MKLSAGIDLNALKAVELAKIDHQHAQRFAQAGMMGHVYVLKLQLAQAVIAGHPADPLLVHEAKIKCITVLALANQIVAANTAALALITAQEATRQTQKAAINATTNQHDLIAVASSIAQTHK